MAKISLSYPESGLTVNVSVLNQSTEVQDFSGVANEIGSSKVYVYTFTEVANTDYVYTATVTGYDTLSGAIFRDTASGGGGGGATAEDIWSYTDRTLTQSIGGGSFNMSGVTGSINNLSKLVKEENEKMKEFITQENIDTNSHIDIAKGEINDKIEKIEIPEAILEEKEAKKALKIVTSIDKKLSGYIESEMKEKEEIGAISRELTKLELEDEMSKKEKEEKEKEEKKIEEEEKKKEEARIAELLNAEFDKLEEQDKEEKKKELEKELEETLKEAEELKKELKTL